MPNIFDNTFQKGLNSDYQILYQPDGTYRYLKNCQLISQDGNNYAIKDCLGNTVIFTINPPYYTTFAGVGVNPTPLAFISFPNKLIVLSTNYDGSSAVPAYIEIGKLEYLPYGEGMQPKTVAGQYNAGYIPLYHHASLKGDLRHRIEGFAFKENEFTERIYWTDNYNEPRVFNISDPIFTTYFATGSLVTGDQYMILEGAITHNAVNYGPGLPAGNVFTAVSANYTNLTGAAPTPKVVVYYPYQLLDWTPSRTLGNIQFDAYSAGSLYCGSKVYYYRLSIPSYNSSWSYGCSPILVGTDNTPFTSFPTPSVYHDFVGGGTTTTLLDSGRAVVVQIENIDTNFQFIELACAEFDQSNEIPRSITIVAKSLITGTTMTMTHDGTQNLGELTIGDITLFPASILKVKTLTTNKNYNVPANITEREELDIDLSAATVTSFEYPMNVHFDPNSCSLGGMVYTGAEVPVMGANPGANDINPWSRWYVTFGNLTTDTVVYDGNNYITGQVITGTSTDDTILFTGTGSARPCVTRNRYTTQAGDRVENAIEITGAEGVGFWDLKEPAVDHHATGYWSKERYRYGFLPYDLKGNPYYVRWLADYSMPSIDDKSNSGGLLTADNNLAGDSIISLNPSGVKFSNIIIPPDIIDKISGFSIVRAERDPIIVTQGLVTQCVHSGASPDIFRPASYIPVAKDVLAVSVTPIYCYLCPDSLVSAPMKSSFGQIGDVMSEACWTSPFSYGGALVRAGGGEEQVYSKIMGRSVTDDVNRDREITYFDYVNEGATLVNLGNGDSLINYDLTVGVTGTSPDTTCIPLSGGAYTLDNRITNACKKIIFKLETDFPHYAVADGYASIAADDLPEKILMNYTKTVAADSLYGGAGDDAKANTLYISTGHFQPITAQVKTDTFDGNNYVFDDVEVFGGDCKLSLIDIGYGLWDNAYMPAPGTFSYAWTFPCECNANYALRRGRKTSNVQMYWTDSGDGAAGPNGIVWNSPGAENRPEDYSYNIGYSTEGQMIRYPALPINFVNANEFEARIRYSAQKIFGEIIDSFRIFALGDYKDLSGQNGRINNVKTKEDKVFVWQDLALSTVPILERQVLTSTSGDATTIGTGGVVDRFDIISSYFGNQHQWGVTETEFGFAWFDMHRKAFLVLGLDGTGLMEVSQVMGLQGFFNEVFLEAIGNEVLDANTILNSPTFSETSDRPLMGVGITGVYDPKNKMTYLCFKFMARKVLPIFPVGDAYKHRDFTIGYLHTKTDKMFVGFFEQLFSIAHNHNQWVLSCNNPKNTTQFVPIVIAGTSFAVGETLMGQDVAGVIDNAEYICILNVTLDNAVKYPLGVSGSTYWTRINKTNQVWVNNQPTALAQAVAPDYLYNKFFGRVVDNILSIVVNPPQGQDETFFVPNIEQITPYNVNYTTIETEGNLQSASDVSITGTNNNYRFTFNKITSNLPLSNTGRIFSNYLKITFTKKNYTTIPTTVTTSVKILQKIRSFFTLRK